MVLSTEPFYYFFSSNGAHEYLPEKNDKLASLSEKMNSLIVLTFRNPYFKNDYDIVGFKKLTKCIQPLKNKIVDLRLDDDSRLWVYYGTRLIIHFTVLFIAYDVARRKQTELSQFYYKSKFSPLSLSPIRKRLIIAIGRLICANGKKIPLASEYIDWVLTTFDFCGLTSVGDREIITLQEFNHGDSTDTIADYIKRNKLTRDEAIKAIATILSSLT